MEEKQLSKLVTGKEKFYFALMLIISLIVYLFMILSVVAIPYILIFALVAFYIQGIAIGSIKQNSVKITPEQFGDIYAKIQKFSREFNMKKIPDVYLMESGGILNAFATRFLFKDIVVIYSDILELAYEEGESAVDFVIAHELAHVKRGHMTKRKWIIFGNFVPYLGNAYSRACEYTCDRFAASQIQGLPLDGLLVLAAGKKLYKKVDYKKFIETAEEEKGYWTFVAEILSSHPTLAQRVENLTTLK